MSVSEWNPWHPSPVSGAWVVEFIATDSVFHGLRYAPPEAFSLSPSSWAENQKRLQRFTGITDS